MKVHRLSATLLSFPRGRNDARRENHSSRPNLVACRGQTDLELRR